MSHDMPGGARALSPPPELVVAGNRQRLVPPLAPERESATSVLDHQPAAQHAPEVREVRDAGGGAGDAEAELEQREHDDEDARRHRDRRKEQQDLAVRKIDAEGEQEAIDRA